MRKFPPGNRIAAVPITCSRRLIADVEVVPCAKGYLLYSAHVWGVLICWKRTPSTEISPSTAYQSADGTNLIRPENEIPLGWSRRGDRITKPRSHRYLPTYGRYSMYPIDRGYDESSEGK